MVPNVIHFIWITGEKSRPFSYFNYMAVKCAKQHHGNGAIIIHCNKPPKDNKWWDEAAKLAVVMPLTVPTYVGETEIKHVQYASDVVRLTLLLKWGGIYIDTDMLLIKPLTPLMNRPLTMAIESLTEDGSPKSVANGVILAAPRSDFLDLMLKATPQAMANETWANHAVTLPLELANAYPDMVHLEEKGSFFPFDLSRNYPFEEGKYNEYFPLIKDSYGLHIYETFWRDQLKHITEDMLKSSSCLFSRLFLGNT
jgi:mannosyltransferase OCH1-like enzyme